MGSDEAALLRLWREKRGEAEPEDLSDNLIVQLGLVTEPLNRHWFAASVADLMLHAPFCKLHVRFGPLSLLRQIRWIARLELGAPTECGDRAGNAFTTPIR